MKSICVYSVTGKTRVKDTEKKIFGLLCFTEIIEFVEEFCL
jgi:8-oxo-dGTP diphosphatase